MNPLGHPQRAGSNQPPAKLFTGGCGEVFRSAFLATRD